MGTSGNIMTETDHNISEQTLKGNAGSLLIVDDSTKKKGRQPSKRRLAVADWTILVTNVPSNLLTADEALTVMRIRWQIELIFKLWKSVNSLDKSRSEKKWRILTEVYGKLLVVLLQHWLIVMGAW